MNRSLPVIAALLASLLATAAHAQRPGASAPPPRIPPATVDTKGEPPAAIADDRPACLTPVSRDAGAKARQDEVLRRVREATPETARVVFIGDSITEGWENAGLEAWKRDFAPLGALEIGVGGDRTEHLLWRLQQAPLKPLDPKVIVLMIGTNNASTGRDTGELITRGVRAVAEELHAQCPAAKVLVLDIPPRGAQMNPLRGIVLQVNQALSQVAWPEGVRFVRVADQFARGDGGIDPAVMPDFLHFSPKGYDLWARAILPAVTSAMPAPPPPPAPAAPQEPAAAPASEPPQAEPAPAAPPAANPSPRTGR
ncbi:MAG: GDSL-type esterase/lipase family protein [Planctomycetota bacterium]